MSGQQHLVYKRRLAVVHVGNDGNVSYVLHIIPIISGAKLQFLPYICGISKKKML